MRYDESEELLGPQPIGQSPNKATDEGSHNEHEVELPDMHQSIDKQRNNECYVGRTLYTDTMLHKATPKDFLSWSYNKKEKKLIGRIYAAIGNAIADERLREALISNIEEEITK